jgi:hypothetical protein
MRSKFRPTKHAINMDELSKKLFLNNTVRSCETWENLKVGDTVYLINPFYYGHNIQHKVSIQTCIVSKIILENNSKSRFFYNHFSHHSNKIIEKHHFIYDILQSGCKIFTHSKEEAEAELKMVHAGKYARFVEAHHESFRSR